MGGRPLGRRTVLRSLGVTGLGAVSAGFLGSCAQDETIGPTGVAEGIQKLPGELTIVGLNAFSGMFAAAGKLAAQGEKIAIAEQPEVAGLQVGHQPIDTHANPDAAVRAARQALSNGNMFFTGATLSPTALALSDTVNTHGGVYTTAAGAPELTGERCRSATFRWSVPSHGAIERTVVPLLTTVSAPQRWYTITPRSVLGESLLRATTEALRAHGATHVGNSFHSLHETTFTSQLQRAADANPDMLLLLNFGPQVGATLKEASSLGLKEHMEICAAWSMGLTEFKGLAPGVAADVYSGAQYWHTTGTRVNREFVPWATKALGHAPGDSMAAGYACTKLLLDGIQRAGGTDPAEVIAALEDYEYEGLTGTEKVRGRDHQVLKDYYLLRGKPESAITAEDTPVRLVSRGKHFLEPSAKGCSLTPLGQQ